MSRPVEFHNLRLAAGSQFYNLVPEQVAVDPTPLTVPRIWFNTTEGVIKFSVLVEGTPTAKAIGDTAELEQAILTLEGELTDYVDSEIAKLGAAFSYRGTVVPGADEPSAFDLATLNAQSGYYYKAANDGYVTLAGTAKYLNEKDGVLFNSLGGYDIIDNSNSEVQGTTGEVVVTGSSDTGFTVALAEAVKTQLSNLATSTSTLLTQLDNVKTAAGLSATGQYVAPTGTNYLDASTSIPTALSALDTSLKAASDAAAANGGALTALTGEINGNKFRQETTVAALTHTFTHNFGTPFVHATVWVKDEDDGHWYNDVLSVRHSADGNSTVVTSTVAVNVAVVIERATDVGA